MVLLLEWKIVAEQIKNELKSYFNKPHYKDKFVAIYMLGDNHPGNVYVKSKVKFAKEIWLKTKIIWASSFDGEAIHFETHTQLIAHIKKLNTDKNCIWIMVQLPLWEYLVPYKSEILASIDAIKDIDWLSWKLFWLSSIDYIDFVPATPASVLSLLNYYKLDNFIGKKVAILGQSNLVWKPLAVEIIRRWGEVFSFNEFCDPRIVREICKISDIIISATWKNLLIDENFVRDDQSQILVDVGRWFIDWKPVGDVNFEKVKNKVKAITPVPGWVWPLTVANLFNNIRVIENLKEKL